MRRTQVVLSSFPSCAYSINEELLRMLKSLLRLG